jgi:hypothetical protein
LKGLAPGANHGAHDGATPRGLGREPNSLEKGGARDQRGGVVPHLPRPCPLGGTHRHPCRYAQSTIGGRTRGNGDAPRRQQWASTRAPTPHGLPTDAHTRTQSTAQRGPPTPVPYLSTVGGEREYVGRAMMLQALPDALRWADGRQTDGQTP